MGNSKYYLTEVDKNPQSIFCYLNLKGETLIEPHSHVKGQFLYAEGGVVHVKTNERVHYLPARHFMWIPSGVRHAIYPSSKEVVMKNLYFPNDSDFSSFYDTVGIYPLSSLLMELLLFTKNWNGDIFPTQKNYFTIGNTFKVLLEQTVTEAVNMELPHPTDTRLVEIINYLTENIHQEHLLPKVAATFSMSDKSLYRLFKKDVGMSFIKYYTQLRIFISLEYLLDSKYNISEIATMIGYSSLPTFSNTFIRVTGKRPSDYRRSNEVYL